jgi:hypothetical protein
MTMPIPNLTLSAGGGGPSSAGSNAGVQVPVNTPFNFDGSGWVINFGDGNSVKAGGNTGANQSAQTPDGAGSGGGLLAGINPNMLLIGAAVLVLLRKRS